MEAKWWIHLTKKLNSLCHFSCGSHGKKEKDVASESESDSESESESDESDDDEFNQHLAHLSNKDKLMVLKLIEKIQEQEETLHDHEEFLINKIKCLEKLTKKAWKA